MVAVSSIAAYVTMHQLTITQETSAAIVNTSGRQRMLSQKSALYSTRLATSTDEKEQKKYRKELTNALLLFEKSHESLTRIDSHLNIFGDPSEKINQIYYGPPNYLDRRLKNYKEEIIALMSTEKEDLNKDNPHLKNILANAPKILDSLDLAVSQYQAESEAKITLHETLEMVFLSATLLILLLLALFIYRPIVKRIENETDKLNEANLKLLQLSAVDGLTGISNRRAFEEFFEMQWRRATREEKPVSAIMIDIDFFKNYNDAYGHLKGDDCLKSVTSAIRRSLNRPADMVARYGGEEFIILLGDTDVDGAMNVAKIVKTIVEDLKIRNKKSEISDYVTVSAGVATTIPKPADKRADLIEAADNALYKAKHAGRNRIKKAKVSRLRQYRLR